MPKFWFLRLRSKPRRVNRVNRALGFLSESAQPVRLWLFYTYNTYRGHKYLLYDRLDNWLHGWCLLCKCNWLHVPRVRWENEACCEECHQLTDHMIDKDPQFHWWSAYCFCTRRLHEPELWNRSQVSCSHPWRNSKVPSCTMARHLLKKTRDMFNFVYIKKFREEQGIVSRAMLDCKDGEQYGCSVCLSFCLSGTDTASISNS